MKKLYSLFVIIAAMAVFGAYQTVNIGTNPNDGTGDTLRNAFTKVNANFAQVTADFVAATNKPGYGAWLTNWDSRTIVFSNGLYGSSIFQWGYMNGQEGIELNNLGFTVSTNLFVKDSIFMYAQLAYTPPWYEGKVFYDNVERTLAYYNDAVGMTVNIGQESIVRVDNKTGANISDGKVVYISGAHGHNPEISLAVATNELMSCIIGVTTTWVTNNSFGYVTTEGLIHGLDTQAIGNEGAAVYVSTNTPGLLTTNDCRAPFHSVQVGIIAYSHPTQGILFVSPRYKHITASNITDLANFTLGVSNVALIKPQWNDFMVNYAFSTTGPNAPNLTAVTNGSVIQALAFDNADMLYAQCQFPHNIATTNALFPQFIWNPHIHFSVNGTIDATHSNVTWRAEWELASINQLWNTRGTNSVTTGITQNGFHYVVGLGPITNAVPPGISTIFRCRLMRPASAAQDFSNAHDVFLDGFDLHLPVGNTTILGSREEFAQ